MPTPPLSTQTQVSAHNQNPLPFPLIARQKKPNKFPEDGVLFRVFYRNIVLLHLRILLLPFIVLLQNEHTTLAENGENLVSTQPRISTHLE